MDKCKRCNAVDCDCDLFYRVLEMFEDKFGGIIMGRPDYSLEDVIVPADAFEEFLKNKDGWTRQEGMDWGVYGEHFMEHVELGIGILNCDGGVYVSDNM